MDGLGWHGTDGLEQGVPKLYEHRPEWRDGEMERWHALDAKAGVREATERPQRAHIRELTARRSPCVSLA